MIGGKFLEIRKLSTIIKSQESQDFFYVPTRSLRFHPAPLTFITSNVKIMADVNLAG